MSIEKKLKRPVQIIKEMLEARKDCKCTFKGEFDHLQVISKWKEDQCEKSRSVQSKKDYNEMKRFIKDDEGVDIEEWEDRKSTVSVSVPFPYSDFFSFRRGKGRVYYFNCRPDDTTGIGKADMMSAIQTATRDGVKHLILIGDKYLSHYAIDLLKKRESETVEQPLTLPLPTFTYENFIYAELQFNISTHMLQPVKMEWVNHPDDLKRIVQNHCVGTNSRCTALKCHHLQSMLTTDPMARFLNLQVDDIVKIVRGSSGGGFTTIYRLVVENEL
jgi:RNA polymerase Rpb5, C-terminal domain